MRRAVWLFAAALASPAVAGPCDGLADPLAYNACLARQGPTARGVHVGPAPARGAGARVQRRQKRLVLTRPRARSELVFSPGE